MSKYADSTDFAYMHLSVKPPSIWDRLLWWLQALWREFISDPIRSDLFWGILALIALGFGIFYVMRMKFKSALVSSTPGGDVILDDFAKESINYSQLINQALDDNDFRMAIRYLYLKCLQGLSAKEVIEMKEWKTPHDYLSELPQESRENYDRLALLYEFSWYGDFGVKRADFDKGMNYVQKLEEGVA